ncbi:MAG: ribosome biogenesis GTP-binding protein YihA/YsxC [Oscillospiraceae bacterium]|nr:ribosome biogenesis GTP-binding protein YihA/YsxC [Oscillospiraceae bacterium]
MKFQEAKFEFSCVDPNAFPKHGFKEIVFSGRSNVGKSSLINKLFNKKTLARTSSKPGKTTSINFYKLKEPVYFVDLPGYGYAKMSYAQKEKISRLVECYFQSGRKFDLVVQVIDARHPPTKDDLRMLEFISKRSLPFIIVFSKKDKLKKSDYVERLKNIEREFLPFKSTHQILFSSLKGDGVLAVKKAISNFL